METNIGVFDVLKETFLAREWGCCPIDSEVFIHILHGEK